MNVSDVLVTGVVLIILVIIITFMLEFFIPINKKIEFDRICSQYVFICDQNNGLTLDQKEALVDELQIHGFENIVYQIPALNEKAFNEQYLFHVQGDYDFKQLISLFSRQKKRITMEYDYNLINRKVIN